MAKDFQGRGFLAAYERKVSSALREYHRDNHDSYRFGPPARERLTAAAWELGRAFLARRGLVPARFVKKGVAAAMNLVESRLPEFEWLYSVLDDDLSRRVLVDVVAYRALGNRHVVMPLNTPEYWRSMWWIDRSGSGGAHRLKNFKGRTLLCRPASANGRNLKVYSTPGSIMAQFGLQQYRCDAEPRGVAVERGDVVLDCGGGWGDTALYMAAHAGHAGQVHSFEFIPENIEVARKNLALNPEVSGVVKLHEYALWDQSGKTFYYLDKGPSSRIQEDDFEGSDGRVRSITIDDFVSRQSLPAVNFIKMDIEGAEVKAIMGARHTIQTHTPFLAISVYHRFSDLYDIPRQILGPNPSYRLHLRHFTTHAEETVLFARAG